MKLLPPAQLWVLALLATAGTPLERTALASIVNQSRDELAECLEPLERQGLIV